MRKLILLTIVIFGLVAAIGVGFSQKQTPQQKSYSVTLTFDEWQSVLSSVEGMPFKTASPIINKIVSQVNTQLAADTVKPKSK